MLYIVRFFVTGFKPTSEYANIGTASRCRALLIEKTKALMTTESHKCFFEYALEKDLSFVYDHCVTSQLSVAL